MVPVSTIPAIKCRESLSHHFYHHGCHVHDWWQNSRPRATTSPVWRALPVDLEVEGEDQRPLPDARGPRRRSPRRSGPRARAPATCRAGPGTGRPATRSPSRSRRAFWYVHPVHRCTSATVNCSTRCRAASARTSCSFRSNLASSEPPVVWSVGEEPGPRTGSPPRSPSTSEPAVLERARARAGSGRRARGPDQVEEDVGVPAVPDRGHPDPVRERDRGRRRAPRPGAAASISRQTRRSNRSPGRRLGRRATLGHLAAEDLAVLLLGVVDPADQHPVEDLLVVEGRDVREPPDAPLGDGAVLDLPVLVRRPASGPAR